MKKSRVFSELNVIFMWITTVTISLTYCCLIYSPATLYPWLSISHLRFHSLVTVWTKGSFSTGLAATVGRRKTDRESERGGLADTACYFSSTSHWLSALGSPLEKPRKCRMAWKRHPSVETYHRGGTWWKKEFCKCYVLFFSPLLYI